MARILLAEDEAEIRTMVAEALTDAGHQVTEAESGDAGALLLDGSTEFDLLLTDINMPGSLDGIGLAALFRKIYAFRPVLYITGRPDALRAVPLRPSLEAALFKPQGLLRLVATAEAMLVASLPRVDAHAHAHAEPVVRGARTFLGAP